jgi:sugar phosphate permease
MTQFPHAPGRRFAFHYAWVVVAIVFLALLVSAGVRAAPAAMIKPLEAEFGWDRSSISAVIALSILMFGLGGPIGGGLVDRFGPRRVTAGGLGLIAVGLVGVLTMDSLAGYAFFWGIVTAIGTGAVANVLGATVANRWFRTSRGLVIGLFSAAASMGQLLFLPTIVAVVVAVGWQAAVTGMAVVVGIVVMPALLLIRDRPGDVGLRPVGDDGGSAALADAAADTRRTPLREATRTADFWLLASSFFICGFTSNGLIGTHLLPHAVEHGFSEITAATAVGLMGLMNVVGTLGSGWLTDRYDNRRLLAAYYAFRAISIFWLPFVSELPGLYVFAIVYGLDWIATVPPTANLTGTRFGRGSVGTIFGWIFFGHMVGAAIAALAGGIVRDVLGEYTLMFIVAALFGFLAAALALWISDDGRAPATEAVAVPAP